MICQAVDNNTKKFQEITSDNAAALVAVAWAGLNFSGSSIDGKVENALSFINDIKQSNPQTKTEAGALLSKLESKGLIAKERGSQPHYSVKHPEMIQYMLKDMGNTISLGFGDISGSGNKYNYVYRKTPANPDSDFMADFDKSSKKSIEKVGEGMVGFVLMSTDGVVSQDRVNQTVDYIAERIARDVINGEPMDKAKVNGITKSYMNLFIRIKDAYAAKGSESGVAHMQSYLDNWDNLESMIFYALKRRSGLSFKDSIDSRKANSDSLDNPEGIQDNNEDLDLEGADKSQSNYSSDYSITLDSKAGLSGKLKLFLSTLENGDKHYLTKDPLFEKFDTVYNTLNAFLAGSNPNIFEMIERLKEFQEYQWVSNLIAKLNEAMEINSETKLPKNMTLIKQFVTAMNKHYINMHHVQWSKSGGEYKMDVFGDNSNSRTRVILNDWSTRMQSSNLVSVDEFGRRVINPAEAQKALELFDGLFENKFNSSKKEVFDAFDRIGIRLSYPAIERMLSGNFTYGARKFAIGGKNQLFLESDSHSPISNVYKTLIAMANTDGNVELGVDSKLDMFSNGSVKALATFEARFSKHLYSNSHRSGNKTVFSYTNDKFIADRVNALISDYKSGNKDGFALIKELENDVFAKDSYWLQQLKLAMDNNNPQEAFDFIDNFEFGYLSLEPIKKSKGKSTDSGLVDLSPQEIIATKLGLLHNNDLKAGSRRVGRLFYPTMSDKSNMLTIQSLLRGNIVYKDGSIDDDTIEFIFDKVVSTEMNRMWEVSKSTDGYRSSTGIEFYDNGSRIFYTIPELNILKEIFKINENNIRALKSEAELSNENILSIKDAIKDSMNMMIQNQIEEFKNNGIGYNKETGFIDYVDSNHIANIKSWYDSTLSNSEVSDAIAADYAINYFIHNVNIAQLFHGDYALYNKSDLESFDKNYESREFNLVDAYNLIKPAFDNLGKRLAADLAPGYEADYGTRTQIKVTVSNDREVPATAYELAEKVFSSNSQTDKNALDAWSKLNSSDAQSWVSLDFHLDTLFNFGNKNVNEDDYFKLKAKIAKAKSDKKDVEFSQDELKLILQPTKPLYSNNTQKHIGDGKTIGVRHYIKTSSFPLIPQLVKGSELENFMRAMEKNEIDMHVFASGYKVGASSTHKLKGADNDGKISIFNEDGSMNINNVNELGVNGNFTILPIAGYKIQQEVPYHDHPGVVNKGTQESKALFTNIKNLTGFKYGDNDNLTGAELEEVYNNKYKQLYEKQALKLKNEIFKKTADGSLSNSVDVQKLQSILKEEANGRGYSINDLLGLDIEDFENAFKYPLWALPSAKQYESLIISIADNRVRKLKIPGNSFVLGSEAGFKFKTIETFEAGGMDTIKKYQDKIIFTSKFNGEYLQSYRTDGDGVKPSQVFVPMKLKGSDGHFIDLMKYTFIKDGKIILDESRLPESVLKLFGFRIPTQGHNSMAALEIAGFLPEECGDLIIASQDLVVQMGSDFDIDKLYTYNYSTKEIYDNGVPRVILDNEFSLENDILDIHLSVFNNNNPELYKLIMSPNGFGQLKTSKSTGLSFDIDNIKTIASGAAGTTNFLSPQYQMSKFFNGVSGKMGCLGYGTKVLMFNGTFKEVQDVVVGDKLMGIDSTPRTVLKLCQGVEQMYIVRQNRGIDYRVNESHILSLHHIEVPIYHKPQRNLIRTIDKTKILREKSEYTLNIKLSDFLGKTNQFKNNSLGYKSAGIEFDNKYVSIDPYYIGLWLGDGRTNDIKEIATVDYEVERYLINTYGIKCSYGPRNISKRCYPDKLNGQFKKEFNASKCGLNPGEKHIPDNYLYNSKENRLKLLAGLIDSDGGYCKLNKQYIFTNINKRLIDQIAFLTRSLGFYTSVSMRSARISKRGLNERDLYTIRFVPECDIPVLLPRKRQVEKSNFKNRLHTGISIEKDTIDNYYGFVLDGDHLFMLEDFTVTHNTGVFSSLSMLNSIAQEKGLEYVRTDENGANTFNVRFGDQLSIGKLGSVKTLNDKYYISKVIEAFQSASVDNEKEQILYKLNINKYTVSAINALAMLGFDEEVICYFINQPIIEEFVAKSMSNDSSLNGFVETLNNDVALDMIDDYKKKYKGLEINNSFKNAGVDALKEQMSIPTNIRETIPVEYYSKQLAMLEKFSELTKVGQDLQSLMQTINAESKGLGRTIFGSIDRESKVDNIDSVKTNISNGIPTTGVLNAGRLLDNTMNGFVIDYGTRMLNSVGAQLFPYRNEDLLSTMSFVSSILEKKGSSISSTEEFMYDIFTAMKSYIFSNPNLYGKDFNPTQKRKDLFLGETEIVSNGLDGQYHKNIRVVTKPSLADTINAIKDLEIGKSNALLRALSVDLSQKSSDFKLVKYMASASQNLDESDIHQAFISLFRENIPVEYKVGDRIFSTTTTELAENLIMYAYLSGGTQEAIQFTKYIPIDVLDYMGFMDKLSSMSDRINPETFGNTLNENKQIVESKFAEQYIQNNPSIVPTKIGDVGYDAKKSNKISNFEYGIVPGHGKIITKFKPKVSEDPKNSPGAALVSKKYIGGSYMTSDYIPGIGATNVKHVNVVYKKIGDYFVLMPTLGSFGVSEYSSSSSLSEAAKSSISNRNILDQSQYDEAIESVGTSIDEPKESLFKDFNENEIMESGNPVEFILTKISDMYGDPLVDDHLVSIAKRMLMNTHIIESLSDLKFEYATRNFTPAGRYTYGSRLLQINGNESRFNDKNHLVETLLHELEHSYTSRMIRFIEDKQLQIDNPEEYNSIPQHVFDAYNEINQTRRGLLHIASRLNTNLMKEIENAKNYSAQQDRIKRGKTIPEDELIVAGRDFSEFAYGMAGNLEFATMVSTNNAFRESIDNLGKQYKSGKSIVDKIFDALLKFLGLDTMPSNLKDHFKEQVLKFNNAIDMSIAKEAPLKSNPSFNQKFDDLNKFFDELESGKFDKKVIELNRDWHGINNKFELGSGNSEFSMDVPDFNEVNRLPFKDNRKLYKDLKLVKLNGDRKMISNDNKSFLKYINNFNGNEDNKYTMKTVDVYGDGKQFYVSVYKKNKPEISGLNNLFLIPSQSEVRALEAQFGPTAMDQYNALPNEDKRRILKCLKI